MPRLEFSEGFAGDLALVKSKKLESRILTALDHIEMFGEFGSKDIPESIRQEFGEGVRKVALNPFDLVYTFYPSRKLVRIEALVHQKAAW